MPEVIRLHIVTDNPEAATLRTLTCNVCNAPSWARVVSKPEDILKIPNGAKCIGVWFSNRHSMSEAEKAWRDRKLMDGIVGLDDRDWVKLEEWIARREAETAGSDIQHENADIPKDIPPSPETSNPVQTQEWI